jgi:hypothetical protein
MLRVLIKLQPRMWNYELFTAVSLFTCSCEVRHVDCKQHHMCKYVTHVFYAGAPELLILIMHVFELYVHDKIN